MNFKHYKIRCSSLPKIVGAKGKLTQAAESYLRDLYIKEAYGREKTLVNKYMTKGNEQEDESISLYRKVNQIFTQKNELKYANDFIEGTPDLVLEGRKKIVIDIKTCWDIWTYVDKDRKTARKDYFWQLAGYSMLTGIEKVQVAYTLLSNSEYEIYKQYEKAKWNLQIMEDGTEDTSEQLLALEDTVRKNNTYDDIPSKERVKVFDFTITPSDYTIIKEYVEMSREYLNKLKL
jgi:hypothetical protein